MGERKYAYPRYVRICEISAIVYFVVVYSYLSYAIVSSLIRQNPEDVWWVLAVTPLAGYAFADFISGLFHFAADRFGNEEMWFFGQAFVRPFREHHVDPQKICRNDFVERNGSLAMICVPVITGMWIIIPFKTTLWGQVVAVFGLFFFAGTIMTQAIHSWAHMDNPPRIVQLLQRAHLILPRDHHEEHHKPPHLVHYCITVGWANPVLDRIGFFQRLERFIARTLPNFPRNTDEHHGFVDLDDAPAKPREGSSGSTGQKAGDETPL